MSQEKEFFIIDSHAYLYKNYFALPRMLTSKGEEVGALYGFVRLLLKIIRDKKPKYLAVCYDSPGPTKREEKYSLYKANRPKTDRALIDQINLSWLLLEDLGIKTLKAQGFEADDIMAVLSEKSLKEGLKPIIVSQDKDIYSLISKGALVWDASSPVYFSEEAVLKKFSVPSYMVEDFLALTGDSSDNIPGAQGIGPKTAAALLKEYGSLEEIIKACEKEDIKDKNILKVKNSLNSVKLSKELVKLDFSAPCGGEILDFAFGGIKTEKISFWAQRLEFKELYALEKKEDLFSFEEIDNNKFPEINFTDMLNRDIPEFSCDGTEIFDGEKTAKIENLKDIVPLLKTKAVKYLYAAKEIAKESKISSLDNFEDIKLAYYLVNAGQRKPQLDSIIKEFFPNENKKPVCFLKDIFNNLKKKLEEKKLSTIYEQLEKPFIFCLCEMENNGMAVDKNKMTRLDSYLEKEINSVLKEFKEKSKEEINLNSPKQVSFFLYEKLNLPLTDKQKSMFKTKTGYSTSEEALYALRPYSDLIDLIIKYRELSKLRSSFTQVLSEKIFEGRVRSEFDQTGTSTGRLSSSNPNLQNIPVKTEYGKMIRACFVSSPGFVLVSADYSQIDLRVLAHESLDERLKEAFEKGEDIHIKTACRIFAKRPQEIDSSMRRIAKTVNFGVIYGQSANGLSRELSIPQNEAAKYIEEYFDYYKGVKEWSLKTVEFAKKNGYCANFLGRRRELPDIYSANRALRAFAERIAVNMPIQSGSGDIIKKAMINIYEIIKGKEEIKLCSQVHDELIFEIKEDKVYYWAEIIKREMENSFKLSVPVLAEIKAGPNWAEMKPLNFGRQ
ncbi:MAG: DNA polymerase [Elusimicrobiota bacterium]